MLLVIGLLLLMQISLIVTQIMILFGVLTILSVTGNADITTNNFANSGTITAETLLPFQ